MVPSAREIARVTKPAKRIFGLTLGNIPTMNLRGQYAHDRKLVYSEGLDEMLHGWKFQQIQPLTVTYPDPDVYFTQMIRTTVVGLECTLQIFSKEELLFSNRLTEELRQKLATPTTLSRSMVDAYYNKMPAIVNPDAALQVYDVELWAQVNRFYKEIRNPLFHGNQLYSIQGPSLLSVFDMFDKLFCWIDTWTDPMRIHKILACMPLHPLK